ncbi:unnamed protein product [Caenorhabditis auriculariae]|uniref:Uncharacterized protein n=1 Tax=Caenorhabditis auriculariae TaxID=2777116 RepID=A0A8S1H1X7_9PELO|nr:unnamed protein product [Caenorhabditis auriculariae]
MTFLSSYGYCMGLDLDCDDFVRSEDREMEEFMEKFHRESGESPPYTPELLPLGPFDQPYSPMRELADTLNEQYVS